MATWVDGLSLTLEVAFANDPYDTSPTWTDISEYLCPWSIQVGRSDESNDFAPGTMSLQLRNDDRRFDPDHASGPYFGDLVPMKPIRLSVTYSAVTHVIFNGFVLGWPQQWGKVVGNAYVNCVDGTRAPENAELAQSAYQWAVEQDTPVAYWQLQESDDGTDREQTYDLVISGSEVLEPGETDRTPVSPNIGEKNRPLGQANGWWGRATTDSVPSTLPRTIEAWLYTGNLLDANGPVIEIELPFNAGNRTAWRLDFFDATDGAFEVFFTDAANSKRFSTGTSTGIKFEQNSTYHVVVTTSSTDLTIYLNGAETFTATLATGTDTGTSQTDHILLAGNTSGDSESLSRLSHVAIYDDEITASEALTHYEAGRFAFGHPIGERSGERIERVLDEIGFPSGKRTIATGETVQGPYLPNKKQALDYIREVEAAEQGLFFFDGDGNAVFIDRQRLVAGDTDTTIVLSDDGDPTDVTVADVRPDGNSITTVRNIVTTSYSSTGAITRRDTTSIGNYLEQRQFIDAPTLPNGRTASLLSAYVLRLRKDPLTRVPELVVSLREDVANHFQILSLLIGDVVTFQWTPMNIGSALSKRLMVQGIRIDGNEEDIRTTLYLSPAVPSYTEVPYLTLGDATYGQIGATAGNLIPY